MNKQHRFTVHRGPLCLLLAMLAALGSGCTRAYYRQQADQDAYELVAEKATHPHWMLDDYTINVDPRSRMYDAGNPDRPPLPPDDPTAHQLMHCVDGKKGFPGWHDNGETPTVENTAWPAYIEFDEQGVLKLTSDDAVRLALLHSPNYQQNLEELYLSALDVSFERFRFDVQGFAGGSLFYTADGPRRGRRTGVGESSSLLELNSDFALRKAFSTGATLAVNLANELVWQFSGPDDYAGTTIIDFALFQPLLRGAGRDRILERLTRSERTLLANVRAMEQYQQSFYVSVMTGRNAGNGPNRQGGVFGGSGLEGFTGTGGGGFGRVGAGVTGGGGGNNVQQIGGYIGLLQGQQLIRNQEDNVERLRSNLFRAEQFLAELRTRAGDPTLINSILRQDLQVAQARQALFSSESQLLLDRAGYQATLDNFKTATLGLPPEVCMGITDNLLDQFELIDRGTLDQQEVIDRLIVDLGDVRLQIASRIKSVPAQDPNDPTRTIITNSLEWYPELKQHLEQLKAFIEPLRDARTELLEVQIPRTENDLARFETMIGGRQALLLRLKQQIDAQAGAPCPLLPIPDINQEIFNVERLERARAELGPQLASLRNKISFQYATHLDQREARINKLLAEGETYTPEQLYDALYNGVLYPRRLAAGAEGDQITDILVVAPGDLLALQLVQARARAESIELQPVDIKMEQALEVARKYRRDWMNARQGLVDAWRLIEFNADNLESTLDVFFSGDVRNQSDNPFRLRSDTGRLRVGVQFDAPITRLSERNTYRQALIEYQQARRSFYRFEDSVAQGLRATLRSAQTNQINFELQRLSVLEAARQIDRNEDIRIDQELTAQSAGATAARDAVSALTDLLRAQNTFMSVWVNHEALRRSLDLDLGTLQLDSEGIWIDPGKIDDSYGLHDPWLWRNCLSPTLEPGEDPAEGMEPEPLPPAKPDPKANPAEQLPAPLLEDVSAPTPANSSAARQEPAELQLNSAQPLPVYGPAPRPAAVHTSAPGRKA